MPPTPQTRPGPAGILRTSIEALRAGDVDAYVDLFAPDAVMELPFAPPGSPRRLDGADAVRAYVDGYPDLVQIEDVARWEAHGVDGDPETAVVEFALTGRVVATGRPYRLDYVAVVRVVEGRIRHYRDYWSPDAAREVLGEDLLEARR